MNFRRFEPGMLVRQASAVLRGMPCHQCVRNGSDMRSNMPALEARNPQFVLAWPRLYML
jgi:hypothetical protein